jgi:hypothetical protein
MDDRYLRKEKLFKKEIESSTAKQPRQGLEGKDLRDVHLQVKFRRMGRIGTSQRHFAGSFS